jgi:hypothetical protein
MSVGPHGVRHNNNDFVLTFHAKAVNPARGVPDGLDFRRTTPSRSKPLARHPRRHTPTQYEEGGSRPDVRVGIEIVDHAPWEILRRSNGVVVLRDP